MWLRRPRDPEGPGQNPLPASVTSSWLRCLTECRPPRDPGDPGGPEQGSAPASLAESEPAPGLRMPAGTSPGRASLSSVVQAGLAVELGARLEGWDWTRRGEARVCRVWLCRLLHASSSALCQLLVSMAQLAFAVVLYAPARSGLAPRRVGDMVGLMDVCG